MTGIDCGSKVNFHCTIIDGYSTQWNGKETISLQFFFSKSTDKWHHFVQVYRIELNTNASSSQQEKQLLNCAFHSSVKQQFKPNCQIEHKTKITLYTLKIN